MKRRVAFYFLGASAIGLFFLWMAVRKLPYGDIGPYLAEADASRLVIWSTVFVGVYAICHYARVVRWDYLVRPLGDVETRRVHRASAVGFTAILLLPLRLGEFVRPALLARRSELTTSSLLATAVVERVIDGLFVTGLLFLTLTTYTGDQATGFARTTGWISAAIFIPALFVCTLALWRRQWTLQMVDSLVRPVSESGAEFVEELLDDFIDGFTALSDRGTLAGFLGVTGVYWVVNIVSLWILAYFGFGFDVGLWQTATVIAILVIGIMIPAGPALTGNFEFFLTRGMALFVAVEAAGVQVAVFAFAALVHILQFVVIVVPGFWVMWTDPAARHLLTISQEAQERLDGES
jgi:uncharacterized protein (TIRG00374 family)